MRAKTRGKAPTAMMSYFPLEIRSAIQHAIYIASLRGDFFYTTCSELSACILGMETVTTTFSPIHQGFIIRVMTTMEAL
jgi:hypothetical protein